LLSTKPLSKVVAETGGAGGPGPIQNQGNRDRPRPTLQKAPVAGARASSIGCYELARALKEKHPLAWRLSSREKYSRITKTHLKRLKWRGAENYVALPHFPYFRLSADLAFDLCLQDLTRQRDHRRPNAGSLGLPVGWYRP